MAGREFLTESKSPKFRSPGAWGKWCDVIAARGEWGGCA